MTATFNASRLCCYGLILAITMSCCACQKNGDEMLELPGGLFLGNSDAAPQPLYVGTDQPVDLFFSKNDPLKISKEAYLKKPLDIALIRNLDVHYDDGQVKFHVGCASSTNIKGDEISDKIRGVSFQLCAPAINDWRSATHQAAAIAVMIQQQNSGFLDLTDLIKKAAAASHNASGVAVDENIFYKDPSVKLLKDISGYHVFLAQRDRFPLSEAEANKLYAEYADEYPDQAKWNWSPAVTVPMAAMANEKILVAIDILKSSVWGGNNLTESQKKMMKYEIEVTFVLRH